MGAAAEGVRDPLPVVRRTVRRLLEASPEYARLGAAERREMARSMVAVSMTAANLLREELEVEEPPRAPALADALAGAGEAYSGAATERIADTTHRVLNAVSFPRFVSELINGVFKAIVDSNQTQLQQYLELLNNVAATTEGFADANLGPAQARRWIAERFPGSYEVGDGTEPGEEVDPEDRAEATLRLRPGAAAPTEAALRTALALADDESVPAGDPERVLVPLARRALARQRQGMLATLVTLGMQRIVVDSGRVNAAMRFHIDTRSAAESDVGSRFDTSTQAAAAGSVSVGPWGASASLQSSIGYVSTQQTRTTEATNTDLELTSSVELNFHSDYLPLNRLATPGQQNALIANTLNPEAEIQAARAAEAARRTATDAADRARREALATATQPTQRPPLAVTPPRPASGGTASGGGSASSGGGNPGGNAGGTGSSGNASGGNGAPGSGTGGNAGGAAAPPPPAPRPAQ
jgi:hypothetical protein